MKWTRDQYLDLMTFGPHERPMLCELFGPLIGLDSEWRQQGATEDEINMTAFDFDFVERVGAGGICGPLGGQPSVIIEENDDYLIQRDYLGRTTKLPKAAATIPLPLDFPVKTMDDWLKLKPLFTYSSERLQAEQIAAAITARRAGKLVVASIPGGYDVVRELMGEVVGCMAYYEQPELIADIMQTLTDTSTCVLKELAAQGVAIDQLSVHEDFAGKSGPLIGPVQIREHLKPYYLACWEVVQTGGGRIFCQDTDGNINPVMDVLLESGLTSIHPMEPAAGMDIVALRQTYGTRLAMKGGIDKHVIRQSREAIDKELDYKLQPLMRDGGGIVFSLDHRIPNGTPIALYRYYVDQARERLGIPARDCSTKGWARMAF